LVALDLVDTITWASDHPLEVENAVRLELRQIALLDPPDGSEPGDTHTRPRLSKWSRTVGNRRIAELALDEGELLALRLPALGARLLDLAAEQFDHAHDPAGTLLARVAQILALMRAQKSGDGAAAAKRLRDSYQALSGQAAEAGLPTWEQLLGMVERPTAVDLASLSTTIWRYWLHRLLAALAWSIRPAVLPRLTDALTTQYGQLPAELRPQPAAEPAPRAAAATPPGQPAGWRRYEQSVWSEEAVEPVLAAPSAYPARWKPLRGVYVALVILTAIGLILAGVTVLLWLLRTFNGPAVWVTLTAAGLVLVAFGVWAWLRPRRAWGEERPLRQWLGASLSWLRTWRPRPLVVLDIDDVKVAAPGREVEVSLFGPVAGTRKLGGLLESLLGRRPDFSPYHRQVEALPAGVVAELGELRRRHRRLSVALAVAPNLAELPWEALLLTTLEPRAGRVACWRYGPNLAPLTKAPIRRTPRRLRLVPRRQRVELTVVVPETWFRLAAVVEDVRPALLSVSSAETPEPLSPTAPFDLLLVVGIPAQTSAGPRILVQSPIGLAPDEVGVAAGGRDYILEPYAPTLINRSVVVVMGEPVESLMRVDAEREQTADLRRCAADLFAAGAPTVLYLPSLPLDTAARVLVTLLQRQRVMRRGWRGLIEVSEAVRAVIANSADVRRQGSGAAGADREGAHELALEVTMFTRL
jgi:hypothetical protein